jgi:inner membrane protein involved in colicin E2 resistance
MTEIISLAIIIIFILKCITTDPHAVIYRVIGLVFIVCFLLLTSIFGGY